MLTFLVKNIIKTVESKILIPITKDKLLEEFLIQHLKELIYRTRKGYKLKDYIVEEKEEDKLYLIIKKSLELITQQLGSEIEKDEIHLLKIHFLASMERINKLKIVKNISENRDSNVKNYNVINDSIRQLKQSLINIRKKIPRLTD